MDVSAATHENEDGFRASYNSDILRAKVRKAHIIGETLVAPVSHAIMTTVLKKHPERVLKAITLSIVQY